jgi:DNA-binding NarL/FixJ family response regulator
VVHEALEGQAGVSPASNPGEVPIARTAAQLTSRELEIATFISRGMTNRQIAEELVVSPRTVEWHVANLIGKLGFRSRSQIAAWAAAEGLT